MIKISLLKGFVGISLVFALASSAVAQKKLPGPRKQAGPTAAQNKSLGPRNQAGPTAAAQKPGAPKVKVIATHGKWRVICTDNPIAPTAKQKQAGGGAGKSDQAARKTARRCNMSQRTKSPERKGVVLGLEINTAKQNDKIVTMMNILVPVGVYLPLGIAFEVDGDAVGRVPFTRCTQQVCAAFAEVRPETLTKMRKGKAANFIIYEAPGVGFTLPISLAGFTAAYKDLIKQ